jgi:hypothetical protein
MDAKLNEVYAAMFVLLGICVLATFAGAGKDVYLPIATGILGYMTKAVTP